MDLDSLPDEQYYLHLPLLRTYDDEDYFLPVQWSEDALWRKMYVTRAVLPVHVVDGSPIAHRWEIAPKISSQYSAFHQSRVLRTLEIAELNRSEARRTPMTTLITL